MKIAIPRIVVLTTGLGIGTILGHAIEVITVYDYVEVLIYIKTL